MEGPLGTMRTAYRGRQGWRRSRDATITYFAAGRFVAGTGLWKRARNDKKGPIVSAQHCRRDCEMK